MNVKTQMPKPDPDKPGPNTFYVWPQKTQNNTEIKNLFL